MAGPTDWWAKSPRNGEPCGELLVEHTLQVVARVAALRDRAPFLPETCGQLRLWHRLGLAAALHDLGKADPRFQKMLQEPRPRPGQLSSYDQRHEVLSLAWLDWALGDDPHEDRKFVAAAIASHHKDFSVLTCKYSLGTDWNREPNVDHLVEPVPSDVFGQAASLFLDEILPVVRRTGLLDTEWAGPSPWQRTADDRPVAVASIRAALREWECWMDDLREIGVSPADHTVGHFIRGLILLADHAGSAGEVFRSLPLLSDAPSMTERLKPPAGYAFYPHQDESADVVGHALLMAPTGSGKTEAALRWAARQYAVGSGHPPLFYVLPFKASMNAMWDRLIGVFAADRKQPTDGEQEAVALQHSSALQVLYHELMEREASPQQAEWLAKRQKNLAKLHTTPIRVLSPYQLLRAAYQLKGHEAIWTDAAGGLFIFDEIHAYEPQKLARILEMLRFLVDRLGAKAFVMTATMPAPVRRRIEAVLGQVSIIRAADKTFAQFKRHRLVLRDAGLLDESTILEIVRRTQQHEAVLCVATTVGRAQELRSKLQRHFKQIDCDVQVDLLHSRFTSKDRSEKERQLQKLVRTELKGQRERQVVLVATQVVEVSIDVDFDVLFTDPAPLECLLQRFGRVNRSRRPHACDVIVCTTIPDKSPVYDDTLIKLALESLKEADDEVIDECRIQGWLDHVYGGDYGRSYEQAIEIASQEFRVNVLDKLCPFETSDELEDLFFKQFDGAEVLPLSKLDEYRQLLKEEPVSAMSLMVPVSHQQLMGLKRSGKAVRGEEYGLPLWSPNVVDIPYDKEFGLQLTPLPKDDSY